jgi:hypothetical protein
VSDTLPPDPWASSEAELKSVALHHLGWEVGAGATIWARVVSDVLALHESAREELAAEKADMETWERLHGSALTLVVAIDQIVSFEKRVRKLTGDAELQEARDRFDWVCPQVGELRDLVAHLDEYAVGRGRRQVGGLAPPLDDQNLASFIYWGNGGGTVFDLGGSNVNLRRAAEAAIELAQVVERVRARWQKRMHEEGQKELRLRWERNFPGIELPPPDNPESTPGGV